MGLQKFAEDYTLSCPSPVLSIPRITCQCKDVMCFVFALWEIHREDLHCQISAAFKSYSKEVKVS